MPGADGNVTFGMIYATQPFNNQLVTMTISGAELKLLLEQGFIDTGPEQFLTPSAGFTYTVDRAAPRGCISAMLLNGKPIDPATDYRVSVSDFERRRRFLGLRAPAGQGRRRGDIERARSLARPCRRARADRTARAGEALEPRPFGPAGRGQARRP